MSRHDGTSLAATAAGLAFQNPVLLAGGTAGYGREIADVVPLELLGGLVTKAVSPEPRAGNAAPRVADFDGGMINAVGLAEARAAAVERVLLQNGIPPEQIQVVGMGESVPVASNANVAGRQQNRRVEIVIANPPPAVGAR